MVPYVETFGLYTILSRTLLSAKRMIHLVGTNHELQHLARPKRAAQELVEKAREEFQEYLCAQIKTLNPAVVAEESVEEVLKYLGTRVYG
jgi:hypothetical protein